MMKATVFSTTLFAPLFAILSMALPGCTAPGPSASATAADTPAHTAPRVVDGPVPLRANERNRASLESAMLTVHNAARSAVGVAPLTWDATLADHATTYARTMAASGRFAHANQHVEGENLFTGTRNAYAYAEMAQLWVDERRYFVNRPTPDFSTTGQWADVGHYTQIVWRGTQRFGCGLAASSTDDYLVCRYAPAGNVVGQRAF